MLNFILPMLLLAAPDKLGDSDSYLFSKLVREINSECKDGSSNEDQYNKCKKGTIFQKKRIHVYLTKTKDELPCETAKNTMWLVKQKFENEQDLIVDFAHYGRITCPGAASFGRGTVLVTVHYAD